MPQFVKLVNQGRGSFDFHQNNAKRIIPAGEDAIVPWDIAVSLFGHPNVPDVPPENARTKAYEKVRARHNFSSGLQSEDEWDGIRPRISVYDLEGDKRIVMLIDDPVGEHMDSTPQPTNAATDVGILQQQIAALTAQVQMLVNREVAAPAPNAEGTTASPTPTADAGPAFAVDLSQLAPQTPTATTETPTRDDPQAVTTGETPSDDTPPPRKVAAKVAAKKVAAPKVDA